MTNASATNDLSSKTSTTTKTIVSTTSRRLSLGSVATGGAFFCCRLTDLAGSVEVRDSLLNATDRMGGAPAMISCGGTPAFCSAIYHLNCPSTNSEDRTGHSFTVEALTWLCQHRPELSQQRGPRPET